MLHSIRNILQKKFWVFLHPVKCWIIFAVKINVKMQFLKGKTNFSLSDGQNSSTRRVFGGGESIASNIFDARIGSGAKNLEYNVLVDPPKS